ncbi:hypothetical protein ACQKPX_05400 [Photobacterium sp. DNB23_23_1]
MSATQFQTNWIKPFKLDHAALKLGKSKEEIKVLCESKVLNGGWDEFYGQNGAFVVWLPVDQTDITADEIRAGATMH